MLTYPGFYVKMDTGYARLHLNDDGSPTSEDPAEFKYELDDVSEWAPMFLVGGECTDLVVRVLCEMLFEWFGKDPKAVQRELKNIKKAVRSLRIDFEKGTVTIEPPAKKPDAGQLPLPLDAGGEG